MKYKMGTNRSWSRSQTGSKYAHRPEPFLAPRRRPVHVRANRGDHTPRATESVARPTTASIPKMVRDAMKQAVEILREMNEIGMKVKIQLVVCWLNCCLEGMVNLDESFARALRELCESFARALRELCESFARALREDQERTRGVCING